MHQLHMLLKHGILDFLLQGIQTGGCVATTSNPVLAMLKADHKKVKALFTEYHQATPWNQKDLAQTTLENWRSILG